ncbi:MAG: Rieske 2Fe-2S domain-containing protein [Chloroflexi bacterium]|nr:Rieske 2Fe-2S domain-containing protein [Chloroflexota bacterium]
MLSTQNNQLLMQTNAGTPMGHVMRRYWMPALLAWELPGPDCPPVRVRLLGENLVAFRDSSGRIGLVQASCPHRRASLFWGRNEEDGIRCVYHGWKFNVEGRCTDMPSEPETSNFKDKVSITAYPTEEQGGIIRAYMGPADRRPAPPLFEWTQVTAQHRSVNKVFQESNWLQGLEGGVDSIHVSYLHNNKMQDLNTFTNRVTNALIEVTPTDYGYTYGSVRKLSAEEGNFVKAYHYVMPFTQLRPDAQGKDAMVSGHMWVPVDDEHCMVYNWVYTLGQEPLDEESIYKHGDLAYEIVDVNNGFKSSWNYDNDYGIDREVQRATTYTGIPCDPRVGANLQDRAIQESMGAQCDRENEHPGTSDRAIIMARRMLLQAATTVADGGDPPGVGSSYYKVRSIEYVLPADAQWHEHLAPELFEGAGHTPVLA